MEAIDVTIIGAGVIGLAVAAEVSQQWPYADIAVLEKNLRWGQETSSRNSEVIHAGLYYPVSSLKTRLCREGNSLMYEYCNRHSVPNQRIGKLVVALNDNEICALEELYEHARQVGARVELLNMQRCRELEPEIPAKAALYSLDTGIIDSEALMRALYNQAVRQGVAILFATPAAGAARLNEGYLVQTPRETIRSRIVINCAGLYCDQVADFMALTSDKPRYRLHYCKGEYYSVRRRLPVRHLIYPLPGEHSLGVHLTMDLGGNFRLGPNAYYVDQIDYAMDERNADEFYRQAAGLLPGISRSDIYPGYTGIRPKLQGPHQPFHDFTIRDEIDQGLPGWINLIGIESPGLTSSLAIAREVARQISSYF